jgi:hypothetical protein
MLFGKCIYVPILNKIDLILYFYFKIMAYDGNSGPDLGQAQKCCSVKPVDEIPTLYKIHQLKLSIGFY